MADDTPTLTPTAVGSPEEAVVDLSPGLHNFVCFLAVVMLVSWAVKTASRARQLLALRRAVERRDLLRLDGLSAHVREGGITREHLQNMLQARSKFKMAAVEAVRLGCHLDAGSVRLLDRDGAPALAFRVVSDVETVPELLYGLPREAVDGLAALAAPRGRKKASKKRRKRAQDVEMDVLGRRRARDALAAADARGRWKGGAMTPSLDGREVTIPLDAEALAASAGDDRYAVTLLLRPREAGEPSAAAASSENLAADANTAADDDDDDEKRPDTVAAAPALAADGAAMELTVLSHADGKFKALQQLVTGAAGVQQLAPVFGADDEDCVVCLTNPADVVLLPCSHNTICHECQAQLQEAKCVSCRAGIVSFLRWDPTGELREAAAAAQAVDDAEGRRRRREQEQQQQQQQELH